MDSASPYFRAKSFREGGELVIEAAGELDAASSDQLSSALDQAEAGEAIALDLGGVSFIDSSGLRVIAAAMRRADADGRRFRVAAASDAVRRIFEVTGLQSALER
jgi:anti-sigma B factor antagonist